MMRQPQVFQGCLSDTYDRLELNFGRESELRLTLKDLTDLLQKNKSLLAGYERGEGLVLSVRNAEIALLRASLTTN